MQDDALQGRYPGAELWQWPAPGPRVAGGADPGSPPSPPWPRSGSGTSAKCAGNCAMLTRRPRFAAERHSARSCIWRTSTELKWRMRFLSFSCASSCLYAFFWILFIVIMSCLCNVICVAEYGRCDMIGIWVFLLMWLILGKEMWKCFLVEWLPVLKKPLLNIDDRCLSNYRWYVHLLTVPCAVWLQNE